MSRPLSTQKPGAGTRAANAQRAIGGYSERLAESLSPSLSERLPERLPARASVITGRRIRSADQ